LEVCATHTGIFSDFIEAVDVGSLLGSKFVGVLRIGVCTLMARFVATWLSRKSGDGREIESAMVTDYKVLQSCR
jgi:hypothetical protein